VCGVFAAGGSLNLGRIWNGTILYDCLPPTETATYTPSDTPTDTATYTPSDTPTITITATSTATDTSTATNTLTTTPTFTFTVSHTLSPTTCVIGVTAPDLISPAHRAHISDTTPTYSWSFVPGAQSYRIMIYLEDRSFEFKKRVFGMSYTMTEPLVPHTYLWRVRTQDFGCGTWSAWSRRNAIFVD
jgi:hypothetical protein